MNCEVDCIKLFSGKEYADQFIRGDLRMTRITRYRTIECEVLGVKDSYEGKVKINCPEGTRLFIDIKSAIISDDNGQRVYEWNECPINNLGQSFVGVENTFCLCATDIAASTEFKDDKFRWTSGYLSFLDGYECGVLFAASELASKLQGYADSNGFILLNDLVRYEDKPMSLEEAISSSKQPASAYDFIFTKDESFSYQHEYRFALMPTPERIHSRERIASGEIAFSASVGILNSAMYLPIKLINEMGFEKSVQIK